MEREHLSYVFKKTKEIEEFASTHNQGLYDDYIDELNYMVRELEKYGKEHGIPVKIDVDELVYKHFDGYYEEESSSYYEEDYSDYEDEEYSSW